MNQYEAVAKTIDRLGGVATLGQLYKEVFKIKDCEWKTKTPFANIRRIVQQHKDIYKIKPGLYGLVAFKAENEAKGIIGEGQEGYNKQQAEEFGHSYYQALLLMIGKLKCYECWAPNQDKNKAVLNTTIGGLRTIHELPSFSYDNLVKRSSTVDVIWFNERKMPRSFFEVEHGTDMHNSLVKLNDLQDFHARMFIVSSAKRHKEYESKIRAAAFQNIKDRLQFFPYESVVKEYEHAVEVEDRGFSL